MCIRDSTQALKKQFLYSWGGGKFGQLGLGDENNKAVPKLVEDLEDFDIVDISCNSGVSAAITKQGEIFTWGRSKGGSLGHGETYSSLLNVPTVIESLKGKKFVKISAGYQHMAAISENGELYTWGNPDHGKLGHSANQMKPLNMRERDFSPRNRQDIPVPNKVDLFHDKKIIDVDCGQLHTIALTEDGQVYTWGSKSKGVLGYDTDNDQNPPQLVTELADKKVVRVSSGADFNLALTADGKVYGWGNNSFGQLGNAGTLYFTKPTKIKGFEQNKIVDIDCGENFSAALAENGELYTWGYGSDGQLGLSSKVDVFTPKGIHFDKKVRSFSCGGSHSAVITTNGELYTFGRGREGQLGRGESIESSASYRTCLLYTSPSPRDRQKSRMPSSA
eukprot:TRINITY_DN558_c0_g1_i5.p1 TRINITY_DN558_c0_g1~~TRINITY_DN558_c0_g1_i5.p1  ORF type:complete len:391 (-),score=79.87 TRINITY_DN558_c0_g1_i5:30-1202(-)